MRVLLLALVVLGCRQQEDAPEPPIVAALHEKRIDDALELLRARVKRGAKVIDPVTLNRGYRGFVPDPDGTTDWDRQLRSALRRLEAGEHWHASRLLRKAQRIDPKSAVPFIYQGLADLHHGSAHAARSSFQGARARGKHWISEIGLIVAYYRLGRTEEADSELHALTSSLTDAHPIHAYYIARMVMANGLDIEGGRYYLGVWATASPK